MQPCATVKTLWSPENALFFLILLIIFCIIIYAIISAASNVKNVKENWPKYRCSPSVMPFTKLFGHDPKQNFEFCMQNIFNKHAQPYMNSSSGMFSNFTGTLGTILGSINSLRITLSSLGGGINNVFSEFTNRISSFFFRLQITAISIKAMIGRMYAILFSIMYMGMSGLTGMQSFTNTFLFSFLDAFCFPGDTELKTDRGMIPIKDIKIGDVIENSRVTATFHFYAKGQPMVRIGKTVVSTNHYVVHEGRTIKAVYHPDAVKISDWDSDLYCLNTHDHHITIDGLTFLDYDETSEGDKDTMNFIETSVNGTSVNGTLNGYQYSPAIDENTKIKTKTGLTLAKDIQLGDKLVTGEVIGLVRILVNETCMNGSITPSTLYWDKNSWKRIGETHEIQIGPKEMVSFMVTNSQIELENITIRDYMELCSPDSEMYYSKCLSQ